MAVPTRDHLLSIHGVRPENGPQQEKCWRGEILVQQPGPLQKSWWYNNMVNVIVLYSLVS